LLAFLAGTTQRNPWRAALLGLGATFAALVGYFLLTDSPLEGAQYSIGNTHGFFLSNAPVILGGIVTGPLFGWFGQQWRTRRAIAGALVVGAAFCLEPLARRAAVRPIHMLGHGYAVTNPIGSQSVVLAEVAIGLALAALVIVRRRSSA
jgi:predicted lysophospholipase L1 biosynthesis ABC-type transport system permease subunit